MCPSSPSLLRQSLYCLSLYPEQTGLWPARDSPDSVSHHIEHWDQSPVLPRPTLYGLIGLLTRVLMCAQQALYPLRRLLCPGLQFISKMLSLYNFVDILLYMYMSYVMFSVGLPYKQARKTCNKKASEGHQGLVHGTLETSFLSTQEFLCTRSGAAYP